MNSEQVVHLPLIMELVKRSTGTLSDWGQDVNAQGSSEICHLMDVFLSRLKLTSFVAVSLARSVSTPEVSCRNSPAADLSYLLIACILQLILVTGIDARRTAGR